LVYKELANNPRFAFFIYEDYPYVNNFLNKTGKWSAKNRLEKLTGLSLDKKDTFMNSEELVKKLEAVSLYGSQVKAFKNIANQNLLENLEKFTKNRCFVLYGPCEVLYQITGLLK